MSYIIWVPYYKEKGLRQLSPSLVFAGPLSYRGLIQSFCLESGGLWGPMTNDGQFFCLFVCLSVYFWLFSVLAFFVCESMLWISLVKNQSATCSLERLLRVCHHRDASPYGSFINNLPEEIWAKCQHGLWNSHTRADVCKSLLWEDDRLPSPSVVLKEPPC